MTDNPFSGFLKIPSRPSTARPTDREQQLNHQALEQAVAVLQALLGNGDPRRGKAVEYFENVTITSTGTTLKHQLGRQPRGYITTYHSSNRVVYSDKEGWTSENVVLYTGAGTAVFSFFLFALLVAVLLVPGVAQAACTQGYTQGDVIRLWLCAAASDTTTGASEGDYRFNKDTNALLTYDGAAWNSVGGSGAPTSAQYWVGAADATLSAEHNLGVLATGLVLNTSGTPGSYGGTSCTNQFPRSLNRSGAATCESVALATDVSGDLPLTSVAQIASDRLLGRNTTGTGDVEELTVSGGIAFTGAEPGGLTLSSIPDAAMATSYSGTGACGANTWASTLNDAATPTCTQPAFSNLSGLVTLAQITDDASSGLCLLSGGGGDPAWTSCPGGGGGLSYAQVAAAVLAGF